MVNATEWQATCALAGTKQELWWRGCDWVLHPGRWAEFACAWQIVAKCHVEFSDITAALLGRLGKRHTKKNKAWDVGCKRKVPLQMKLIKVIGCWYAQQRKCAPSASDWTIFCHESAAAAAAVATAAAASAEISIKYRVIQPRRSQCCRLRTRLCVATKTKETVFKLAWNISGELLGTGPESRRSFEGHCRP